MMSRSRCKPGDHRELDALEAFKYISMFLCQINATAFYLCSSSVWNPWKILDFFKSIPIALVISAQIAIEVFNMISTFLGVYQCLMIIKTKDQQYREQGKTLRFPYLSVKDVSKIYLRKYLRLAPFYYFILFTGWNYCGYLSDGPIWATLNALWYNCDSQWWYKLLFIGNLNAYQEPTEGCMYWVWAIQCDMQLHLFVPLWAILYWYSQSLGNVFQIHLLIVSNILNAWTTSHYSLKSGFLAIENNNLLDKGLSKPWSKLFAVAYGAMLANFYVNLL